MKQVSHAAGVRHRLVGIWSLGKVIDELHNSIVGPAGVRFRQRIC